MTADEGNLHLAGCGKTIFLATKSPRLEESKLETGDFEKNRPLLKNDFVTLCLGGDYCFCFSASS
jgi:hypothetical protein